MSDLIDAKIIKYQFEVPIKRSAAVIWALMIESAADGSSLEWYRVQMVSPGKSLYLVGYMAPDWGGPTTSMLKLTVEDRDNGGALIVSDALLGNVTEASANSAEGGWKMLFGDGLKEFVEK